LIIDGHGHAHTHEITGDETPCDYKKLVRVDIEVEQEIEVTSEEDDMNVSLFGGTSRNFPFSASKSNENSLKLT
jgi:hypothetical protein